MKINSKLQDYKKLLKVTNILETSSTHKAKKASNNVFKYDIEKLKELEKDVFLNSKESVWQVVGRIKLTQRDTSETVWAQIKRMKKREKVKLMISLDNKDLIYREMSPKGLVNPKFGLPLDIICKQPLAQNFAGLAKIMDVLAVKESLFAGFKGKMHLNTVTEGYYQKSEPLHWARGFKRLEYFDKFSEQEKKEYDLFMGGCLERYKTARASGKTIEEAKAEMIESKIPRQIMMLPDSLIDNYKKQAESIRYC